MSDDVEWGPWVEHDGKGCPLPVGTIIKGIFERRPGRYVTAVGTVGPHDIGLSWNWSWWQKRAPDGFLVSRIIRYRIRKPRALLDLITLAADPYAPPPVIGPDGPVRQPEQVPA